MKLKHPNSGQTIEVLEEHSDRYVQQGWTPVTASSAPTEPPAGNASLTEWQDYARTQGYTDADLDGKTRADLRAAFA